MSAQFDSQAVGNGLVTMSVPAYKAGLRSSATTWFVRSAALMLIVTIAGQLIFAAYVVKSYWLPAANGNIDVWSQLLTHGYVRGEVLSNTAVASHLLVALVVLTGGAAQLSAGVRGRWPRFHRINGRVYLTCVSVATISGTYMAWVTGTVGGWGVLMGASLNAALVIVFGYLALSRILRRDVAAHQRWILRLFVTAAAVYFWRLELMLWFLFTGGVGLDPETFEGPTLTITAFTQYLLPLAIVEIYLRVRDAGNRFGLLVASGFFAVVTLLLLLGIGMATVGMWFV